MQNLQVFIQYNKYLQNVKNEQKQFSYSFMMLIFFNLCNIKYMCRKLYFIICVLLLAFCFLFLSCLIPDQIDGSIPSASKVDGVRVFEYTAPITVLNRNGQPNLLATPENTEQFYIVSMVGN